MTNEELIAKIKAEIERLKSLAEQIDYQKKVGFNWALDDILSFLSDLEKSVTIPEDFEKEYAKFSNDPDAGNYAFPIDLADYKDFARHFYNLGCRRTAEKYDEIEYNRQREEESVCNELEEEIEKYREEHEFSIPAFQQVARHFAQWGAKHASGSSEIPKDLEEAANVYSNCYSNPEGALARAARRAYITGAKWDREQMMSEAIEATLDNTAYPTRLWFNTYLSEYSNNDKVRVIIIKKEDK